MKKIIKIVMIVLVCILMMSTCIYASGLEEPIENPNAYHPGVNREVDNTKFIEIGSQIIGVIRFLGTAIAVIALMTLGIRYMLGSVGDKALYKETMGPYLIGAIMVFAIPNLIGIIFDLVTANIKII